MYLQGCTVRRGSLQADWRTAVSKKAMVVAFLSLTGAISPSSATSTTI